jgi:hypothetical protein
MSILTYNALLGASAAGGGGGGSSPLIAILGSKLWLHLQLGTGLYKDAGITPATTNGDSIYQWSDTSGNNRHATQTNASVRPTLDTSTTYLTKNTVHFNYVSAGQWFNLPDMSALTEGEQFTVIRRVGDPGVVADTTGIYTLGVDGGGLSSHYRWDSDGNIYDNFGSTARKTVGSPGATPILASAFHVYNSYSASADWQAFFDNSSLFSTVTNTVAFPAAPELGRSQNTTYHIDGNVAHFVMCSAKLTSTERSNAYTALTT